MRNIKHIPNEEIRDIDISAALTTGTIACLNQTDHLNNDDLFEVSRKHTDNTAAHNTDADKYMSAAVSWATILSKVENVTLLYNDTIYKEERFKSLKSAMQAADGDYFATTVYKLLRSFNDAPAGLDSELTNSPYVWNDVCALAVDALKKKKAINDLQNEIDDLKVSKIAYSPTSKFETHLVTFQTSQGEVSDARNASDPSSLSQAYKDWATSGIAEGFIMAFYQTNTISNTYRCSQQGVLCVYGWLDSTSIGAKSYLPDAWCALEGYINQKWEIMALSGVEPNKQLSYVGFTVPVVENLLVRLRIGFKPGSASNRYPFADVPESLSNRRANAFLGGIYKFKVDGTASGSIPAALPAPVAAPAIREVVTKVVQEEPVGTVITHIAKPVENGEIKAMPNKSQWIYCDGSALNAMEYPELASILGETETINLPDFSKSDAKTKTYHYIKGV